MKDRPMNENELARTQLESAQSKRRICEATVRAAKKEYEDATHRLELAKERVDQARERITHEQAERTQTNDLKRHIREHGIPNVAAYLEGERALQLLRGEA